MYYSLINSMNKASVSGGAIITSGLLMNLDAGNLASYSGSGTTWTDLTGNSRNGTLINGVGYSSADSGTLVFDGTNDYVSVPTITKTLIGTNFSISLWFNTISSGAFGIFEISTQINGGSPSILMQKDGATIRFVINNSYQMTSSIAANTWYNVVLTYDATTWKSYINGTLANSYTGGIAGGNGGDPLHIGAGYPAYYNGKIPEFAVYNRPISSTEVTTNFNALKSRYGY